MPYQMMLPGVVLYLFVGVVYLAKCFVPWSREFYEREASADEAQSLRQTALAVVSSSRSFFGLCIWPLLAVGVWMLETFGRGARA